MVFSRHTEAKQQIRLWETGPPFSIACLVAKSGGGDEAPSREKSRIFPSLFARSLAVLLS